MTSALLVKLPNGTWIDSGSVEQIIPQVVYVRDQPQPISSVSIVMRSGERIVMDFCGNANTTAELWARDINGARERINPVTLR